MCSFRRQDHLDNDSSAYVGDLGLGVGPHLTAALKTSDLIVVLGGRFGEVPSGAYRHLAVPRPSGCRLAHVHASPDELNLVYEADLAIVASAPSVVAGLAELGPLPASDSRATFARDLRAAYERWTTPQPREIDGVDLAKVVVHLRDALPPDAVITNGAGNYTVWVHRYHRHRRYGVQLAPTSGAMGYGIPAAIAAKAVAPRSSCHRVRRRRLLHDGLPGAGDGRPVRSADHRRAGRQRHARHHPDAPGAPVPGADLRHRRSRIPTSWRSPGRSGATPSR